jgi:hypothetical protein
MLAGGWPARKRAIAAPERSERVPIWRLANPNVGLPPRRVQARRKCWSRWLLVRRRAALDDVDGKTVLSGVVRGASGARCRMWCTRWATLRTGQSSGSSVRDCVRDSPLCPFF